MNISRLYFEEKTTRTQRRTGASTIRKYLDEISEPTFLGRRAEKDYIVDYYEAVIKSGWKMKNLIPKLMPLKNEKIVVELQGSQLLFVDEMILRYEDNSKHLSHSSG